MDCGLFLGILLLACTDTIWQLARHPAVVSRLRRLWRQLLFVLFAARNVKLGGACSIGILTAGELFVVWGAVARASSFLGLFWMGTVTTRQGAMQQGHQPLKQPEAMPGGIRRKLH